jgi:hypothetical protein
MKSSTSIDFFVAKPQKVLQYMEVRLWPKVLLGAWGTFWEHIGNIEKKKEKNSSPPKSQKKKKKTGPSNAC